MTKIYIIAGEASGDALAARLMAALAKKYRGQVEFYGVGGEKMQAQGLKSLFPMEALSLVGLVEIIPHYGKLRQLLKRTAEDIRHRRPDMLITVDVPDFSLAVAKAVAHEPCLKAHMVAPSVWAWRRGRAQKFARYYDKILCLLPFEPPYFEKFSKGAQFIGHPLWETPVLSTAKIRQFRNRRYIAEETPLLLLLPGSRLGEVQRLMPIFIETARRLRNKIPQLRLAVLTLPHLRSSVLSFTEHGLYGGIFDDVILVDHAENKELLMASADLALAASGTVALELAKAKTSFVVAYRTNPLTAFILRLLLRVKHISLPNIIANKEIVKEFLQSRCNAGNLSEALWHLWKSDKTRTSKIRQAFAAVETLKPKDQTKYKTPSAFAASVLYEALQDKGDSYD